MKRILTLSVCFMVIVLFGSMASKVFAACPDGNGNCDITGEYQINSLRTLKVQLGNSLPRDIFIGDGAGDKNPDSSGRAFGDIFIGRHAGYSLEKLIGENNIGASTIIGDLAAEYLESSVHNTIIGAQANGLACSEYVPCDENPLPQYNTVVGSMAGLSNFGDYNNFFGTEAGKMVTNGIHNILIGVNAGAGHASGGTTNITTGDGNIHIGGYTEVAHGDISYSLAIGVGTKAEDDNQIVVGSDYYYKESYWGSGVTSATPQDFSFNVSGGAGENVAGANLIIAGGKGTGNANGGNIVFQTSPAGASGANQNTLQDRMIIDPNGNVTLGDGSDRFSPTLTFNALYDDCGFQYDSDNTWLYSTCNFNMQGGNIYFNSLQSWIGSPSGGNLKTIATQQLNLQSPIIYLTGTDAYGTPNDSNVKVGIGTANPLTKLAVSGLPNTPPPGSTNRGLVCITTAGDMWVDDDGDSNICQ